MRAKTVRVDRWEKTPARTAQDKIKRRPGRQQPCRGSLFCTNLTQPTGNLDGINKRIVLDILRKEHEKGRAIVVITHDDETANAADKKYILENGKLL